MTTNPNIVLVTIDSLRADHCSFMGYADETTPALDALAETGTVFENAVAPGPSTPESMPAIFTGHHLVDDLSGDMGTLQASIRRHMESRVTLPERLSELGYTTAGVTPNPFTSRYFGFDAGFDHFEDFMGSLIRRNYARLFRRFFRGADLAPVFRLLMNFWQREEVFKPWEAYFDEVSEWMATLPRPYFLWVHLMDPHIPYLPPRGYRSQPGWRTYYANYQFWRQDKQTDFPPELRSQLITAYDDTIRYADAFLGRLREEAGGEPLILVHGDHGEAFGEHGIYGHEPYLYEENIHVPFVIGGGPNRTVPAARSLADLPRLVTRLVTDGSVDDEGIFAYSSTRLGERSSIRSPRLKYIKQDGEEMLYDLAQDESSQLGNEDVRAICRRSLSTHEAADRERRLIRDATQEVG